MKTIFRMGFRFLFILSCMLVLFCSVSALAEGEFVLEGNDEYTWVIFSENPEYGYVDDTLVTFTCADWKDYAGEDVIKVTTQIDGPENLSTSTFDLAGEGHFLIRMDSEITKPGDYTFRLDVAKAGRTGSKTFTVHAVEKPGPTPGDWPDLRLPINVKSAITTEDVRNSLNGWADELPVIIEGYWFGGEDYYREEHFDINVFNAESLQFTPIAGTNVRLRLRCRVGCNYIVEPYYIITVTDRDGNPLPGIPVVYGPGEDEYAIYPADSVWYSSHVSGFYVDNAEELQILKPGSGIDFDESSVTYVSGPEKVDLVLVPTSDDDSGTFSLADGQQFTKEGSYKYSFSVKWESSDPVTDTFTLNVAQGTAPGNVTFILSDYYSSDNLNIDSDYVSVLNGDYCEFDPDDWRGGALISITDFEPDDPSQRKYIYQYARDDEIIIHFLESGDYPGTLYGQVFGFGFYHHHVIFHVDVSENVSVLPENTESIETEAFANCIELGIVIVPDSCKHISSGAFTDCYNLFWVSVPADCVIEDGAFDKYTTQIFRRE